MSARSLIEKLVAMGVDPIDAAEVITEAMIEGAAARAPAAADQTARQARNRRYYENRRLKASENKTIKTIKTDQDVSDAAAAPPEQKVSPTPPSKTQIPIPPSPPKGGSSPTISLGKPNGFARFWEAYPRREAKRAAEAAFAKALKRIETADPAGEILAGVQRAKGSRQWREGFIPHAATWLNRDGWEDESEPRPLTPTGHAEPVTDAELQRRLRHFRSTGEWREAWGSRPEERAA